MRWRMLAWLYTPILWAGMLIYFYSVLAFGVSLVMRAEIVPFMFLYVYFTRLTVPIVLVGVATTIYVLRKAGSDEEARRLLLRAFIVEAVIATIAMVILAPVEPGSAYFGA